jgi:hypothetical protein
MINTSTTQPRNAGPGSSSPFSTSPSFGLRVRVAIDTAQGCLFGHGDGPSVLTRLAEELCIQVARIVVCDFKIHSQLDRTIPAVLRNVRLSFWSCARRAALDAASALTAGAKRRVMQSDLAIKAANLALRIAELCETNERNVRAEKQVSESYERARRSEFAAMHRERREREARRRAEAEESFDGSEESR